MIAFLAENLGDLEGMGLNALVPEQHCPAPLIMVKPRALPPFWNSRFAGKCLSRVCRSVPLEPVRPGGEVGSGGYKAGGILLAFELGFVKVFVGAVFFCHQFVVGACFNDFAVV